jgi:hypothetical protein
MVAILKNDKVSIWLFEKGSAVNGLIFASKQVFLLSPSLHPEIETARISAPSGLKRQLFLMFVNFMKLNSLMV